MADISQAVCIEIALRQYKQILLIGPPPCVCCALRQRERHRPPHPPEHGCKKVRSRLLRSVFPDNISQCSTNNGSSYGSSSKAPGYYFYCFDSDTDTTDYWEHMGRYYINTSSGNY